MENINIAVTGINATDNPGPGSGVIRSLRYDPDFKGRIIGLAYDVMDPGIYLHNIVNSAYLIPYPLNGAQELLERIKYIHSMERIDVIIPTLDAEILNFIKIQDDLKEMGIQTFLPTEKGFKMRSKDLLANFCAENEIAAPKTHVVSSINEIYQLNIQYPVYVKGIFYDARIAYTLSEIIAAFQSISYKWGVPIIIQETVVGEEFDVVALGDGEGGTIGAVPMRKMSLTDKQKAWAGVTIDNPELLEMTRRVISLLKWRGPLEVEAMVEKNTGEIHLIEINPRFPAWSFLAPGAGQNLASALVKLALDEQVESSQEYKVGKLFVRYSSEVLADIEDIEKLTTSGMLLGA